MVKLKWYLSFTTQNIDRDRFWSTHGTMLPWLSYSRSK